MTKHRLAITKLLTGPGDDKLVFRGRAILPLMPLIKPHEKGVRVLLQDSAHTDFLDVTIPGGAYDKLTKIGWTMSRNGARWNYRNLGPNPPGGIYRASLRITPIPGEVVFSVLGRKGGYNFPLQNIPVRGILVVDSPLAITGQCAEGIWPGPRRVQPDCVVTPRGILRCR